MNTPKYSQVQYGVLNLIAERGLKPGDRIPVEKELAALFGVSVVTVRAAMANLENQGIVHRQQGRGTILQQCMRHQDELGTIAWLDIRDTLIDGPILRDSKIDLTQLDHTASRSGYTMRYLQAEKTPTHSVVKLLQNVSGLLVSGFITGDWMKIIKGVDLPLVLVGSLYSDADYDLPHVDVAWEEMSRMSVEFFASRGLRKIILVASAGFFEPTARIVEGYRRGMREQGLPVTTEMICITEDRQERHLIHDLLVKCPDAEAIVVEYGKYVYLLEELLLMRREMPFLSVVGLFPQLSELPPRIINIIPDGDLWKEAAKVLIAEMTRPGTEKRTFVLPCHCIRNAAMEDEIQKFNSTRKI